MSILYIYHLMLGSRHGLINMYSRYQSICLLPFEICLHLFALLTVVPTIFKIIWPSGHKIRPVSPAYGYVLLALVKHSNEGGPGPRYNMKEDPGSSTLIMKREHGHVTQGR